MTWIIYEAPYFLSALWATIVAWCLLMLPAIMYMEWRNQQVYKFLTFWIDTDYEYYLTLPEYDYWMTQDIFTPLSRWNKKETTQ